MKTNEEDYNDKIKPMTNTAFVFVNAIVYTLCDSLNRRCRLQRQVLIKDSIHNIRSILVVDDRKNWEL